MTCSTASQFQRHAHTCRHSASGRAFITIAAQDQAKLLLGRTYPMVSSAPLPNVTTAVPIRVWSVAILVARLTLSQYIVSDRKYWRRKPQLKSTCPIPETEFRCALVLIFEGARTHEARGPRETPHGGVDPAR